MKSDIIILLEFYLFLCKSYCFIKLIRNFFVRSRSNKTHYKDEDTWNDECREKFIYVKDSAELGFDRAIIAPGHFNIEEPGMKYMEKWMDKALPEKIKTTYVQAGDMYTFL